MDSQKLETLKDELIKEKKSILNELIDEENILNESNDYVEDSGEQAFDNQDKDIISKISIQQKESLKKIDKALKKINDGSYGICETCGTVISYERLEILPYTTVCNKCNNH
jgi:DnaK suppressor protein